VREEQPLAWETASQPALDAMAAVLAEPGFWLKLAQLWSQESNRTSSTTELRGDHASFIKSLAKLYGKARVDGALPVIEPLLTDPDKFKQRAAAEILSGLLRGTLPFPCCSVLG
jgi:proteasome activator subunit 4